MSISSNSGCSREQESGWTLYLGESSASAIRTQRRSGFSGRVGEEQDQEEDEEENQSMVSDASSGPPQCKSDDSCNNENEYYCSPSFSTSSGTDSRTRNEEKKKKQKKKCARGNNGEKRSTASSVSVSNSADTDVWCALQSSESVISLQGKSGYPNCGHSSTRFFAEKPTSRKPGLHSTASMHWIYRSILQG